MAEYTHRIQLGNLKLTEFKMHDPQRQLNNTAKEALIKELAKAAIDEMRAKEEEMKTEADRKIHEFVRTLAVDSTDKASPHRH